MYDVLTAILVFVTIALIGVVLIQRSEGGGLGIGGSQGMGAFMSGRGTTNLLTRATAILAALFMTLSLVLALLNRGTTGAGGTSILNTPMPITTPAAPNQLGKVPAPVQPGAPAPARATPGPGAPHQPGTTSRPGQAPAANQAQPGASQPAPTQSAPASPPGPTVPH